MAQFTTYDSPETNPVIRQLNDLHDRYQIMDSPLQYVHGEGIGISPSVFADLARPYHRLLLEQEETARTRQQQSGGGGSGASGISSSPGTVEGRFSTPGRGVGNSGDISGPFFGNTEQNRNLLAQSNSSQSGPLPAIEKLVTTLANQGGSPQSVANSQARQQTTGALQNTISSLTRAEAEKFAQGTINQIIRGLMEQTLPQLTASAEAGGTSQSALRGILTNDAVARTGEAATRATGEAIQGFAGAQANSAQVLAQLTQQDPVVNELLQLIQAAPNTSRSGSALSSGSGGTSLSIGG